jgi:hypothetical protein
MTPLNEDPWYTFRFAEVRINLVSFWRASRQDPGLRSLSMASEGVG